MFFNLFIEQPSYNQCYFSGMSIEHCGISCVITKFAYCAKMLTNCYTTNLLVISLLSLSPVNMTHCRVCQKITQLFCQNFVKSPPNLIIFGSHQDDKIMWGALIVVKPLQMETCLLLTAYRKSAVLYLMVPSPTLYDLQLSHNTAQLAYHSAFWPLKVIQGQWFSCNLKGCMPLLING